MDPVADILRLLLAWSLAGLAVAGWGLGTGRLLGLVALPLGRVPAAPADLPPAPRPRGRADRDRERAVDAEVRPTPLGFATWWLGLPPLLLFLQAWNLALPVGWSAWGPVLLVAAAGGWFGREAVASWLEAARRHPAVAGAAAAAAVLLAVCAAVGLPGGVSREAAAGWTPLVQLGRQWALPPGIGNLSAPLGLNHAWTLVGSLLAAVPGRGMAASAASGLVAVPLVAAAVAGLVGALTRAPGGARRPRGPRLACVYDATGFVLLAAWLAGPGLSDPSPGLAAGAILFVAVGQAVRSGSSTITPHRGERIDRLAVALLLAVAAAVAHAPAALIGGPLILWLGWCLIATERAWLTARRSTRSVGIDHDRLPGVEARRATVVAVGVLACGLLAAWLTRGLISSGRPAYGWVNLALGVPWGVPNPAAKSVEAILGLAPLPQRLLAQAGPVVLAAAVGGLCWLAWLVRGGMEGRQRRLGPLPLVLAAGLSAGLFFPVPTSTLAANAGAAAAVLASGLAVLALGTGVSGKRGGGVPAGWALGAAGVLAAAVVAAAVALPRPSRPSPPPAGEAAMRPWVSGWGAELVVPEGAAAAAGLPGATPMPAAARPPSASLRERRPGTPSAGYFIDRRDPRVVPH